LIIKGKVISKRIVVIKVIATRTIGINKDF